MATLKEGDYLTCEVCDLVVVVDEECGCAVGGLICCEEPMVKMKAPAKAKKKAKPAAKAKKQQQRRSPRRPGKSLPPRPKKSNLD